MVFDRLYGYKTPMGLLNGVANSSIGTNYFFKHIFYLNAFMLCVLCFFRGGLRPNLHNTPIITMTGSSGDLSLITLL